ncbi:MAG: chemotaxis protein CheB [Bacteroidetes bacterium]|nr:chemotaxis protein CheB [Bacteroidales bacterium]MBU1009806.1 chemotaxis protein CheB [Bacteroidota bacterium]
MSYHAIVIGSSAGGLHALKTIITGLDASFNIPVMIVQHMSPQSDNFMSRYLNQLSHLQIKEADEKEPIRQKHVYIAPPNFHLLIEEDKTLSLTVDEKVNYARPSIDVLFESAAYAYGKNLIGIVLTGANSDGSAGLKKIQEAGGLAIIQQPQTAEVSIMPQSAFDACPQAIVLSLEEIASFLNRLNNDTQSVAQPTST